MSGISTGIGLISGIDIQSLVSQLIAIEARPVSLLEARVGVIDIKRTALLALSAQLLAIENSITPFTSGSLFKQFGAVSSDDKVLAATASSSAVPSSYTFRVRSLVASHSMVSRGFADIDTTPVGSGMLTIEVGQGFVHRTTRLDDLFAGSRFRRGIVTITDRAGNSADIDLSAVVNMDDVLKAINSSSSINVRASVTSTEYNGASGDRIVIEDLNVPAAATGNLIIADKEGYAATDLGIVANTAASRFDGTVDLVRLSLLTPLSMLNDGNGVDGVGGISAGDHLTFVRNGDPADSFGVSLSNLMTDATDLRMLNSGNGIDLGVIRITDRSGNSVEIDLAGIEPVRTVGDLRTRIRTALDDAGVQASITISASSTGDDGISRFLFTDTSGVNDDSEATFTIEDVTGTSARDLGIAEKTRGNSIVGQGVYRIATVGDLINAINFAQGNNGSLVEASISDDGNGIRLTSLGPTSSFEVQAVDGSTTASDLGLDGLTFGSSATDTRHLIAGLNTVLLSSLNGGAGIGTGSVRFTDRGGAETTIDFSGVQSLQSVIDLINSETTLVAETNAVGNGIVIRDTSGGAGSLRIEDVDGTFAAGLGIAVEAGFDGDVVESGNLQLQYISRATRLSDLNVGRGLSFGSFSITDSNGALALVDLSSVTRTIGETIDAINRSAGDTVGIEARINDTGDGIIIVDTAGGTGQLTIEDRDGGRTAADLRIAGTAEIGEPFIDGTYETRIEISAVDTLEDVMRKIAEADVPVAAAILNDGSSSNPHSLTFTSLISGVKGTLLVDGIGMSLGLTTIAEAQDAVVTVGAGGGTNPIVISSSSNTMDDLVEGLSLDLLSASDEDVTVTVAQDIDSIVAALRSFVDRYNDVQDTIDRQTSFDSETFERGPLFGDSTVNTIQQRLRRSLLQPFSGADERITRLFSVGIQIASGGRLEFDEETFRSAYKESPEAVEALFTTEESGFGAVLQEVLDRLTDDFDGLITRRNDVLSDQQELLNDRIERLNGVLEAKRLRLEAQFAAMERALAALQGQQSALASLTQLASGR